MPPSHLSTPYRPPEMEARRSVVVRFRIHKRSSLAPSGSQSNRAAEIQCIVPLTGGEAMALESMLQAALRLPPFITVFCIARSDEAFFAPLMPLLLLHGLIDSAETTCDIDALVRPMLQARPGTTLRPPPPPPLPVADLLAASPSVCAELLCRLRRGDGVVRLVADDALASTLATCYKALPAFFAQPTPTKAALHCRVGRDAHDHAYAGTGADSGREWLQLRRRYDSGGTAPTHEPCVPDGTPAAFGSTYEALRKLAGACLRAIATALGADPVEWLALCDLGDTSTPPAAAPGHAHRTAGPSVLRLYRYYTEGRGSGCHAHSDLGLFTLSPCPTRPGLLVYDTEGLEWYEAEGDLDTREITLFAGEQLAYLAHGAVTAPLHRVPPTPADGATRFSIPFFARAHPEVRLVPLGATRDADGDVADGGLCDDLVLERLFRRRPWRQSRVGGDEGSPDY